MKTPDVLCKIDAYCSINSTEDPKKVDQAIFDANSCDVMIIAGTSLVVSPANTLPVFAKQNNALLVEVNPEETIMSSEMDLSLKMTSAKALPNLITIFKN